MLATENVLPQIEHDLTCS